MKTRCALFGAVLACFCACQVLSQTTSTVKRSISSGVEISNFKEIPPASEACDAAACDWWARLRIAGNNLAKSPSAKTKSNFVNVFVEGLTKGYRVPLVDRPPQILFPGSQIVTDQLPEKERNGTVSLLAELRADASIGTVKVTQGLGP